MDTTIRDKDALIENHHFHSNIMEAVLSSSIVSCTDRKGNITFVNKNFEKISGYSKEELLGQPHRIINSHYHPKEFWREVWKKIASGESWRGEVCNRSKNGSVYWVDTFIFPFFDNDGNLKEYFSIRNDITQRKLQKAQLTKSEAQLRAILNSTTDIYFLMSPDLKLMNFNRQVKEIFGQEVSNRHEMERRLIDVLRAQEGFGACFDKALQGEHIEMERESVLPDGRRMWHHVRYLPAYDDDRNLIGVSINLTNIHLRKMQEQALVQKNKILSSIAWSQAHEVRRPVASILGLIQLLERDKEVLSGDEFVRHLKAMAEELDCKIRLNVKQAYEAEVVAA